MEVTLVHTGNGWVRFRIPDEMSASTEDLKLAFAKTTRSGAMRKKTRYLFFMDLIRNGFFLNGAIVLDGVSSANAAGSEQPLFRTRIHLDGDIICKIGSRVLSKGGPDASLTCYIRVRERFFYYLEKSIRSRTTTVLAVSSAGISLVYLLKSLLNLIGG